MTQLEKDQKLASIRTKQQMLEDEYRAVEATPIKQEFKVWEPDGGNKYWDSGTLESTPFTGSDISNRIISTGQVHPTKEAAERHHSFLVMLHDLHKFAVEVNEGWKQGNRGEAAEFIWFLRSTKELETDTAGAKQDNILPYFKPGFGLAQKAIDTFGHRLKILFEYYNS